MTDRPALEFVDVESRFGERVALRSVGLRVSPGEFVALAGPNGSGKSTLLRVALGLHPAARGEVRMFGDPVAALTPVERARRAAWVPQSEDPRDDVPLIDYVLYGRFAHRSAFEGETDEDRRIATRVLREVGLLDRTRDGIRSISGGERQRAILARALAQEAPLLLLDEPTTHLDIAHQLDLLERVRALTRGTGRTVVAALHDLNLAVRFADRIVVLSRGRVVADGPARAVLSEELLLRVWNVSADLKPDPRTGLPYLVPRRLAVPPPGAGTPAGAGPVHVIGGGGSAAPILRRLIDAGIRVTVGALNLLDTDAEVAESLGVPAALEVPFAPIGAEVRRQNLELLRAARSIVLAPVAFGPSNLSNLEDLVTVSEGRRVFLVGGVRSADRDFTGGRASALLERLENRGAAVVSDVDQLLDQLTGTPTGRDRSDGEARAVDHGKLVEEAR